MVKEHLLTLMEKSMLGNGLVEDQLVKELKLTMMEISM